MAKITITNEDLGVKRISIRSSKTVDDKDGNRVLLIKGRLYKRDACRCPMCMKKSPVYDTKKDRYWRTLDVLNMKSYIVMDLHRIQCPEHGVLTEYVPFSPSGHGFTEAFEMTVAWLARRADKTTVSMLMRIAWNTVGNIISRVKNALEPDPSARFDNLKNIGVDETSYKRGYKYITTVVNLDTSTVIWVGINHGYSVLKQFFNLLTEDQLKSIETISGDGAKWIDKCQKDFIPQAARGLDPFHTVEWAEEALEAVRRAEWSAANKKLKEAKKNQKKRNAGRPKKGEEDPLRDQKQAVRELKNSRYALTKNPENLTANQTAKLDLIASTNKKLIRAYRLKEQLRLIFKLTDKDDVESYLKKWLGWAQRCRIPEFVELGRKIRRHKEDILATVERGLSSAKVESLNNKIKLVIKRSYGFRSLENLKSMVLLCCSDLIIPLPNRKNTRKKGQKSFTKELIVW